MWKLDNSNGCLRCGHVFKLEIILSFVNMTGCVCQSIKSDNVSSRRIILGVLSLLQPSKGLDNAANCMASDIAFGRA